MRDRRFGGTSLPSIRRATRLPREEAITPDKHSGSSMPYIDTPTRSIDVDGTAFAYRDLGPRRTVPLILLNHWGAVLDNFDPRIVDGLARRHRVIAIDYRGIGVSGGKAPVTVDEMA